MALAILELVDADDKKLVFRLDAGTNTEYQLQFGRQRREADGSEWVDDIFFSTPSTHVQGGAGFDAAPREVDISLKLLKANRGYVQLFTSKPGGKARAYSDVIPISMLGEMDEKPRAKSLSPGVERSSALMTATHLPPRLISNRSLSVSHQASLESILGELVKIAGPIVSNLQNQAQAPPANSQAGSPPPVQESPIGAIFDVLKAVLNSVGALTGTSSAKSLSLAESGSRLLPGSSDASYAKPFIFGIDDVLIASLVGPVLQALPQLINAANQKRVDLRKADTTMMGGMLAEIEKRMLMEKLIDAQKAAHAQGPESLVTEDQLKAVAELLAKQPAAPVAGAKSLSLEPSLPLHETSAKAVLNFVLAKSIEWNGKEIAVFDRSMPIILRPRFSVTEPAPKVPLAKAILKIAIYDGANQSARHEKIFKVKSIPANSEIECHFDAGELSHLPSDRTLCVIGELRWINARTGRETRALGATEIALAGRYVLKSVGVATTDERELNDMTRFRSFWNKIWEAPSSAVPKTKDARKKYTWDLDAIARYTVLLTGAHDSNGLMESKLLLEIDDPERPTLSIHGRMKAGVEFSVAELNKLLPLWDGRKPIEKMQLEAFTSREFLDKAAREFKHEFKLKGRMGQAGMVWVVPVFKLFSVTLGNISVANENGQVTATKDETVEFPLPVAARLIGLKAAA
jgi:hypothetical protein